MPATEQTWRDQKRLHTIFAVTGVIMLLATIWMFAADHDREWKPIQRTANRVETKTTEWRKLQFETNSAIAKQQALQARLDEARRAAVPPEPLAEFKAEVQRVAGDASLAAIDQGAEQLASSAGTPEAEAARAHLLSEMDDIIADARFREETLLGRRKFKSADRDAAVAALGLLVRDGKDAEQPEQQAVVNRLKDELDQLTREYQAASDHRKELLKIVQQITQEEDQAADALDKNQTQLRQLQAANDDRRSTYFSWVGWFPVPGKKWLELPIADAFNSPRKIDNLWSDGLEIDYNFRKVRRFDRCTTCHQLIQKTMPGSASTAAYPQQRMVDLVLAPPEPEAAAEEPAEGDVAEAGGAAGQAEDAAGESQDADDPSPQDRLAAVYGLRLAPAGLLDRSDVTVQFVQPGSLAARAAPLISEADHQPIQGDKIRLALLRPSAPQFDVASDGPGLKVGDVIVEINQDGNQIYDPERTLHRLLDAADSGEPLVITVNRGMPSPHASHPRLDLFVGSLSPHKMSEFACTICHEGQGSATAFKWASHAPNSVEQRQTWRREYGWFDNHHWIYPMYSQRFAESSCLKCHHDVVELEASERFPDAPAPKVTHGHSLIKKYGCFGCHEVNGYDGPRQIGPDLRLEPNIFAAALQLKTDPGIDSLSGEQADWVEQLIQHPDRDDVRRRLYELLLADGLTEQPQFSRDTHTHLTPLLKDSDRPGQLRKAGPSLRFVGHKVELPFLSDWIREPQHFRPSTRMPQFFGQTKHLAGSSGMEVAEALEPIEVMGLATFLLAKTQPFEYLEPPTGTLAASSERGKVLFEQRGCLACHEHQDFPDTSGYRLEGEIIQGPDLSGIGDKLAGERGQQWLYSWIKEPTRYHARTVMPDLDLEPLPDADGNLTDPAADIVEYLVSASRTGWEPSAKTLVDVAQVGDENLDRLVLAHLKDVFSEVAAEQYAVTGIPAVYRDDLKGAEVELLASADPAYIDQPLTREQKLTYIGGKTVAKYGCYGCHDIPGYEDAKPIGTGLADWGRKDPSKLAFEHILNYLHGDHGDHGSAEADGAHAADAPGDAAPSDEAHGDPSHSDSHSDDLLDPFMVEQIEGHHRTGFIYQKLREPRSYDYHKTENKKYNEWLRMPQFSFGADDREAVMTFVLGLVADPPSNKYIYQPDDHQRAIIEGRQVLEKYNCQGCHMLKPQEWAIAYPADSFGEQPEVKGTFPFLHPHYSTAEIAASAEVDDSGLRHSTIVGLPLLDDSGTPLVYDEEGDPVEDDYEYDPTGMEYPFELWKSTLLDANPYEVGVSALNVPRPQVSRKSASQGGFLAKYLVPRVVAREKQINPNAKGTEAWGWVPPPLIGEGSKVQTGWLHDFLLNPYPIRPAVVLRMPRFNMSPLEASQLVNYFAAVDGAEYPYEFSDRRQTDHLAAAEAEYRSREGVEAAADQNESQRFKDAMNIVVDVNYCVKCHLVGDFEPPGGDIAKAPNLARVYERLRPEYVRDWIAKPNSFLPYTSMPINIAYDPDSPTLGGVSQDLYHGTSIEQVEAVVDLLMNFDEYSRQRSLISPLVKEVVVPPGAEGQQTTSGGSGR